MATSEPYAGSRPDEVVVALRGELDVIGGPAALAVLAAPAIRGRFVLVDLTELDSLDCSTVDALMHARAVARESGGDLVLVNPPGSVLRMLTTLGLTDAFDVAFSPPMNATAPVLFNAPVSPVATDRSRVRARPFRAARQSVAAYVFSALPQFASERVGHGGQRHTK
jgi:anti-sigma B factor antagonist